MSYLFREPEHFANGKFYLCLKDWTIDSGTYFEKGKYYEGILLDNITSIKVIGECEMPMKFKVEDGYFAVK